MRGNGKNRKKPFRKLQTGGGVDNPIIETNLQAKQGEFVYKNSGKSYVGPYHIHKDGTYMIGDGKMGLSHNINSDQVIIKTGIQQPKIGDVIQPTTTSKPVDSPTLRQQLSAEKMPHIAVDCPPGQSYNPANNMCESVFVGGEDSIPGYVTDWTCCDITIEQVCIDCPDCWWAAGVDPASDGCYSNGGWNCNPTDCDPAGVPYDEEPGVELGEESGFICQNPNNPDFGPNQQYPDGQWVPEVCLMVIGGWLIIYLKDNIVMELP